MIGVSISIKTSTCSDLEDSGQIVQNRRMALTKIHSRLVYAHKLAASTVLHACAIEPLLPYKNFFFFFTLLLSALQRCCE